MKIKRHRTFILFTALFTGGLVFLFLPSEIYLGNVIEFISPPRLLAPWLLAAALLAAGLLALPALIPRAGWLRIYAAMLAGVFVAMWVSGSFLVADFGELDGSGFGLDRHGTVIARQTAWFTLVLALAAASAWKWPGHARRAVLILGLGLLALTTANLIRAERLASDKWRPSGLGGIARFSTGKNLLFVVMDAFQSDVLQDLSESDPRLREQLDGFVFYRDTLGVAPTTYLTMPAFHSGQYYDGSRSLRDYYQHAVSKSSFLSQLASSGYLVDLVNPTADTCPKGLNSCDSQEMLFLNAGKLAEKEAFQLMDLGLFRVSPGTLKHRVFDGAAGPVTRSLSQVPLSGMYRRVYQGGLVLDLMTRNLRVDGERPTAKMVHLFSTHTPYMFDRECRFIGTDNPRNREYMTMQARCALEKFIALMDRMREAGVYDASLVILAADTGVGNVDGADDLSSLYATADGVDPGELGRLIGGANPVLAIKYPGGDGPLRSSPAQAQITDIPRTVCEVLGDCSGFGGWNLAEDVPDTRERRYLHYRWRNEYWKLDRIPGIVEHTVHGPLWLVSSWDLQAARD